MELCEKKEKIKQDNPKTKNNPALKPNCLFSAMHTGKGKGKQVLILGTS
jgi:hypothetical protein